MDAQQLKRWKVLSTCLAEKSFKITTPRKEKLISEINEFIDSLTSCGLDEVCDWDGDKGSVYVCDEMSDFLWENRYEFNRGKGRFGTMLSACVRAGFDMAVCPSAGVTGFTVGDLRSVFDGRIPEWVADRFDDKEALMKANDNEGVWI